MKITFTPSDRYVRSVMASTATAPTYPEITVTVFPNQEKVVEYMMASDGSFIAEKLCSKKVTDIDLMPWICRSIEFQAWLVKTREGEGFTLRMVVVFEGRLRHLFWLLDVIYLEIRRLIERLRRRIKR